MSIGSERAVAVAVGAAVVLATSLIFWRVHSDFLALGALLGLVLALAGHERLTFRLRDRYDRSHRLTAAAEQVASAIGGDSLASVALENARDLVSADIVELVVHPSATGPGCWFRLGPQGIEELGERPPADHRGFTTGSAQPAPLPGERSVLVLSLGDGDAGGALVASLADPRPPGGRRTFDELDERLLSSLATATGVAITQSRLIEHTKQEAAVREHQAMYDALTGLPNRAYLMRITQQVLENKPAAVLTLDLQRFKDINDTLGHDHGDVLLLKVALRLQRHFAGSRVMVARLSGDEFAVLLPDVHDDELAIEITSMLCALDEPITLSDTSVHARATVGAAMGDRGTQAGQLLQRAELAMYDAKQRNTAVGYYREGETEVSRRRLELVSALRRSISEERLDVHFQPLLDVATGLPIGAEALVRWTDAELGPVRPDEFVPLAEQSGLVDDLTRTVLDRALSLASQWQRRGLPMSVSVNISPRSLTEGSLLHDVPLLLAQHRVEPHRLVLEITEGHVMQDPVASLAALGSLAEIGVGLSIDDFGTGYSSLAYLKRLPVDEVKIDRSFVQELDDDSEDAVIVRSTVRLAHDLGLRVVAEGVETAVTFQALRELGCDVAQGYLMSRPLPERDLLEWLVQWESNAAGVLAPLPRQAQGLEGVATGSVGAKPTS